MAYKMIKSALEGSHQHQYNNGVILIKCTYLDEPKLSAGSWEDPLPVSTSTTSITTAQLHNSSLRRPDPLCTRSSYNGIPNQLILPSQHHHHHTKSCGSPSTLGIGALGGSGSGSIGSVGGGGGVVGSGNSGADITTNNSSNNLVGSKSESGVGCKKRLEHTPSARTINSSEDSWCSERSEQDLSSEEEDQEEDDRSERSVASNTGHQRNSQLRSTFNKAKQHLSFDKWRSSGGSGGSNNSNSSTSNHTIQHQHQHQQQQQQHNLQQHSSADNISAKSSTMPTAHHHHPAQDLTTPGETPGGRLSRWFSIRRGSSHQYDVGGRDGRNSSSSSIDTTDASTIENHPSPKIAAVALNSAKMPELLENDDDTTHGFDLDLILPPGSRANGTARTHTRLITPMLPPAPQGLSQQQLKRRHIVAAIVHSENSYVATLQRLVNDYKKPLEESSPPVLSSSKISTLFHRLPDILQSHKVFRITLAECVRNWDRDEKIGDVFVCAFSKPQVLEVYSGFINNFSSAMELAKMEEKRKSALADFFKVKQISAHDRLSFFGLMVKPVQRFPQFILFLQDLLKYTPQGHHDRMSLQLALSQLELLAEMLNERKREAEQHQGFKEMLGHISGTFNTRSLTSSDNSRPRYLLREDNVTHMEFNQAGFIVKTKQRRLLLLNDKVICVSVAPKQSHDFGATEKLSFKWMYPVTDVEIIDNSTSATLSRILTAGLNRGGSLKSNSSSCNNDLQATILTNGADNLCNEMSTLMYDYEVISRIHDLVGSLKGNYKELNSNTTRNLLNTIQGSIQRKDEEMAWVDSCCLQLIARNKSGKEETFTFQTQNPAVKKEWITELRLAQLALDTNNSPAWELTEQHHDQRPSSTKMPLFVKAMPVFKSQHQTEVRCGCYYSIANDTKVGTARRRFKKQNYLWVCTSDGTSSHIAVLSQHHQQAGNLKDVGSFDLVETQVSSMEFVKGLENCKTKEEHSSLLGDLIWMGTDSRRILIYSALNPEQEEQLGCCVVPAVVVKILYHFDSVFVALSNATLLIYRRAFDGVWLLKEPQVVQLGDSALPVSSILPINMNIYASCSNRVYVLNALTGDIQKSFEVQHGATQQVNLMAHSGIGLWISLKNSSILCLYHTETFKHLQDINIAASVLRSKGTKKESVNNNSIYVTALMACKGLLWVGTNVGIAVTIPLPRLEGVPIISGGVSMSCHAHFGPITFLLPLVAKPFSNYKPPLPVVLPIETPQQNMGDDLMLPAIDSDKKDSDLDDAVVIMRRDLKDDSLNTSMEQESPIRGKLEKQHSLDQSFSAKIRAQLANSPALSRKRFRDALTDVSRMSKTLPRGLGSASFFNASMHSNTSSIHHADHGYCDVYGLYGKLIFVKEDYDAEEGAQGNLMDMMYEGMRRSDPELAAIPGKVSTLDRRLRMKASRPRSLDLSNWSVDSKSSSLYTSSGSEESMGIRLFGGRSVSRNSSSASHKTSGNGSDLGNISENGTITVDVHHSTPKCDDNFKIPHSITEAPTKPTSSKTGQHSMTAAASATLKRKNKANAKNAAMNVDGPRTIITLMGGRGYWRHVWYNNSSPSAKSTGTTSGTSSTISRVANSNDAHIVVWEKKL
ncbi:rho guanine nucleotide exchange factor 10 isoform X2 [Eupeodes corollae]|uniref:rho guanine nucleotide exchange factor 10 isoform X2 n=1 Tax=Eupeodes corollae TaxID=290404 RepID=UPI00248F6C77|nr:rho guanine nucleotide exchange factor 10 isoform X2 [Eupeodes corollae]XP_055914282.1 rho guanine nucleotide exchange factor 10 isoform X2 [Eupeodes corollae]